MSESPNGQSKMKKPRVFPPQPGVGLGMSRQQADTAYLLLCPLQEQAVSRWANMAPYGWLPRNSNHQLAFPFVSSSPSSSSPTRSAHGPIYFASGPNARSCLW